MRLRPLLPRVTAFLASAAAATAGALACNTILGTDDPTTRQPVPTPLDAGEERDLPLVCAAPEVPCGDTCVELGTNAAHCGACNHDCLGAACADGRCGSRVVADALVRVYSLSADGDHLYFSGSADTDPWIARVRKDGPLCSGTDQRCLLTVPADLLADSGNPDGIGSTVVSPAGFFVVLPQRGVVLFDKVKSWRILGLLSDEETLGRVVAGAAAYAGVFSTGTTPAPWIVRFAPSEGRSTRATCTACASGPDDLTLDETGQWLFAQIPDPNVITGLPPAPMVGVHRIPQDPTAPVCQDVSCRLPIEGMPRGLTFGGGHLWVATGPPGGVVAIHRHSADGQCEGGCEKPALHRVVTHRGNLRPMADAHHLYWVENVGGNAQVRRMGVNETCTDAVPCGEAVFGPVDTVEHLAQDDASIYVVVNSLGTYGTAIHRVAK